MSLSDSNDECERCEEYYIGWVAQTTQQKALIVVNIHVDDSSVIKVVKSEDPLFKEILRIKLTRKQLHGQQNY